MGARGYLLKVNNFFFQLFCRNQKKFHEKEMSETFDTELSQKIDCLTFLLKHK